NAPVPENAYSSHHLPTPVVNGGCGIFDRSVIPVPTNQNAIHAESDGLVASNRHCQRIHRRFTTGPIDDVQYFPKRLAASLPPGPTRHAFGDPIQIYDVASNVRTDDRIAD